MRAFSAKLFCWCAGEAQVIRAINFGSRLMLPIVMIGVLSGCMTALSQSEYHSGTTISSYNFHASLPPGYGPENPIYGGVKGVGGCIKEFFGTMPVCYIDFLNIPWVLDGRLEISFHRLSVTKKDNRYGLTKIFV